MDTPEPKQEPIAGSDDTDAVNRIMPMIYDELRRIAAGMLRNRAQMSVQPTMLVHEAFVRVAADCKGEFNDEAHFRAIASLAMRRVLADHVRSRNRLKRGNGRRALSLDVGLLGAGEHHGAAEVDAALEELEASSPRVAKLVVFRFFGDLSVQQAADRLNISLSTAEADWRFARAWLKRRLDGAGA